jgi:MFS family permease
LLLAVFVAIQTRASHPLLPPRVVLDRNRGGSYLALGIAGLGLFGVFLFLTYYLQTIKGYSPTRTGLAFLPLSIAVVVSAGFANARIAPRTGPRPVVASGMALSALAMGLFAQLGVHSNYLADLLPALLVLGVGVGLLYAPATDFAVRGVEPGDAGVASGLINATNQVGGSLGLALLSTLAATATTHYLAGKHPTPSVFAHAAVHGYTTGFWWAAGFFAAGAVMTGLLLHGRAAQPAPRTQNEASLQPARAS